MENVYQMELETHIAGKAELRLTVRIHFSYFTISYKQQDALRRSSASSASIQILACPRHAVKTAARVTSSSKMDRRTFSATVRSDTRRVSARYPRIPCAASRHAATMANVFSSRCENTSANVPKDIMVSLLSFRFTIIKSDTFQPKYWPFLSLFFLLRRRRPLIPLTADKCRQELRESESVLIIAMREWRHMFSNGKRFPLQMCLPHRLQGSNVRWGRSRVHEQSVQAWRNMSQQPRLLSVSETSLSTKSKSPNLTRHFREVDDKIFILLFTHK